MINKSPGCECVEASCGDGDLAVIIQTLNPGKAEFGAIAISFSIVPRRKIHIKISYKKVGLSN